MKHDKFEEITNSILEKIGEEKLRFFFAGKKESRNHDIISVRLYGRGMP